MQNSCNPKSSFPSKKFELKRCIGTVNFFPKCFGKYHVNIKLLYDLLHYNVEFDQNIELETLFQQSKTSITKYLTMTLLNTNQQFFITVVSSLFGIGCIVFQKNNGGKVDAISDTSRILTTNEQTLYYWSWIKRKLVFINNKRL